MGSAANRIVARHRGPELPGCTFRFSSTSRFWSSVPQCRFLHVCRGNQRVYFEKRFLEWRSVATRCVHSRSLQRSRASKSGNSSGSSKDGKNAGDVNDDAGANSEIDEEIEDEKDEDERDVIAEKPAESVVSTGSSGFWRNLWGKVRQEIDDVNEADANDDDSDSEQEEEQIVGELKEEEVYKPIEEVLPKRETSKKGFWRRWWKGETETPYADPKTKADDELLIRELESLHFRWKELLEPNPENLLALGLTTLLGLAGLQIIWQMVVVAAAITLSALKYTVLAAIIVGLLVFLL